MQPNFSTIVHKFIRSEMFGLSVAISSCDFADDAALNTVVNRLLRVAGLLHIHGEKEDEGFGPLLQAKDPEAAVRMDRDHQTLEARLTRITTAAQKLLTTEPSLRESALLIVYLDWNSFLSDYFAHLDDEECALFPLIAEAIPKVEDFAATIAFVPPEGRADFLEALWAVVTPLERTRIESGMAAQNPISAAA